MGITELKKKQTNQRVMCAPIIQVLGVDGSWGASVLDTRVGMVGKDNVLLFANCCYNINVSSTVSANLVPTGTWISPLEYRASPRETAHRVADGHLSNAHLWPPTSLLCRKQREQGLRMLQAWEFEGGRSLGR